jgi:Ankyrin repeats (3 copies)/Ankyrin repeat
MLRDKFGGPPLHLASGKGHLSIVELLLDNDADVNAKDFLSAIALHQAAAIHENVLQEAIGKGELELTRLIIEKGLVLTLKGTPPPLIFSTYDDPGNLTLWYRNQFGSPLQAAACAPTNSLQLITVLLEKKANPNLGGGEYGSALAAASYFGNYDAVRLLLENGANVNVRGGRYGSVLCAAQFGKGISEDKKAIIAMLKENGAKVLEGVQLHDNDVWRLTPAGWSWLPPENRRDVTSAFGRHQIMPDGEVVGVAEIVEGTDAK